MLTLALSLTEFIVACFYQCMENSTVGKVLAQNLMCSFFYEWKHGNVLHFLHGLYTYISVEPVLGMTFSSLPNLLVHIARRR